MSARLLGQLQDVLLFDEMVEYGAKAAFDEYDRYGEWHLDPYVTAEEVWGFMGKEQRHRWELIARKVLLAAAKRTRGDRTI